MEKHKKRIAYGICFCILLLIEVIIALFINDEFIRPYLGDVLVVAVVYSFVRIVFPNGLKLLPLYVFIFAVFVEAMQYFELVKVLGLQDNTLARIALGSTFDIKDIVCYGVGAVLLFIFERVEYNRQSFR